MSFITRKHLSRRTLLRGVGVSIGLPLLDSMVPALQSAPLPIRRAAFIYTPTGIIMNSWTPATEGAGFVTAYKSAVRSLK